MSAPAKAESTPQKQGAAHFLSPASALSEALGRHRFDAGDKVRWEKSAIQHTPDQHLAASRIGHGHIVGVIETGRIGVDPATGKSSTVYRVWDEELGRECLLSSAALRRVRDE